MSWKGAVSQTLRELRLHMCQTGPGSAGLRAFVQTEYPALKAQYPDLPVLVREAAGVEARAYGRFAHGREQRLTLEGLSQQDVAAKLKQLVASSA
ncbi:hypothetical protein CXG81DRAFT_15071 [Caulochytrium protostelioides]|uniref:Ribosomal protein/NADH dehydrogenase domain-containing protein n=1 Tax=Caulochytrium protostelioides TaxID=1555241 RepID=A0A4P9X1Q7_9FUNG|nr:hypothetical protein CXG81DRAFT_15071 [Caulochytrium protostelioides]|eukprot:RKO99065.1 hypothetical protein CXG81DRAFT_15071 [Caulochytrium protostelioides]